MKLLCGEEAAGFYSFNALNDISGNQATIDKFSKMSKIAIPAMAT